MAHQVTYAVAFATLDGAPAARWSGFASYADARRAISDADMSIPFDWTWSIEAARALSLPFPSHDAAAAYAAAEGWTLRETEPMERGVLARFTG